jgi:NADPH:quinone reductase-like Zn-dependent oxidoreductase
MRRWEMDGIGRENLTLREVPQPELLPGQVLVEVAAVSLNTATRW